MDHLQPNEQRAKNAILLIWMVLVLEVISLISGYFQYELLQTFADGGDISPEKATANDLREQIIGVFYTIGYLISAVMFIQWFRRAYNNLHQKVSHLSFTEGWAAGSWFVPVVNLYRPYQIMKELYKETHELLIKNRAEIHSSLRLSTLGWWWALWIINGIIGQFVFRYSLKAETIEELITVTVAGMIGSLVGIPLVLITVKVIKDYSNVEPFLNEIQEEEEILYA